MVRTRLQSRQADTAIPRTVSDEKEDVGLVNGYTPDDEEEAEAAVDVIATTTTTTTSDNNTNTTSNGDDFAVDEDFDDALEFASAYYDAEDMAVMNPFAKVCPHSFYLFRFYIPAFSGI